jgi:hypothetical protein
MSVKNNPFFQEYKDCCMENIDTNVPLPSCPMVTQFLKDFRNIPRPEEVENIASKIRLFDEAFYIDTINDYKYHEDVFLYSKFGKDLKFLFKRLYASYYKNIDKSGNWDIEWSDLKLQITKDVHRNETILFDNDKTAMVTANPYMNKGAREGHEQEILNNYYEYICNQIVDRNIKTKTPNFTQADLINICVTTVAQTFKATFFADFSMPATGFGFADGPYSPGVKLRYKFYIFMYGPRQNTMNYDITQNTLTYNMYQIVVNFVNMDDIGLGTRLVNIKFVADLDNNTGELKLIFYQSYCLYRHGVYIGEMFVDTDNNNILDADGKGIFYLYDYKSEASLYPAAKISGIFSKGVLKAGTEVDIVIYSSQEEYERDTFINGVTKEEGVIGSLKNIKPGYIKIPDDINLNAVDTEYVTNLVNTYNINQAKLKAVTAERQMIGDIMEKINTLNFLKFTNSRPLKEGTIWFQPDANGRQYFYVGPIQIDNSNSNSNILYVSKYGTIKQLLSNGESEPYISSGELNRQNWYEFVLKPQITLSNYKTFANLPLQWTKYNIDLGFDMLDRTSVKGFFTKEMLETIGKTHNIDTAVFSDKIRLQKILEKVYIEAIIYLSAFNIVLKKYKSVETDVKMLSALQNIDNIISSTTNNTNSDYNSFINFNEKISNIYLNQTNNNENTLTNYSQQIILPILASLRPETSNLFKSIDIKSESKENIEKLLIILTKNIILILYLFTIITANLGDDTNKVLSNYDPLVVTPIFNLFKDTYNNIISNTDPSINPETRLAIEKNADSIISMNTNQMLSLLLMMSMLFDKQTYSGKTSTNKTGGSKIRKNKTQRKTKHYKKWKTRNKNRANKANKMNKLNNKIYTRKYKKHKSRRYSSKK